MKMCVYFFGQLRFNAFKENQNRLPDAEMMIDAATSYLQEEVR